jgi:hypothetical protein
MHAGDGSCARDLADDWQMGQLVAQGGPCPCRDSPTCTTYSICPLIDSHFGDGLLRTAISPPGHDLRCPGDPHR